MAVILIKEKKKRKIMKSNQAGRKKAELEIMGYCLANLWIQIITPGKVFASKRIMRDSLLDVLADW